MALRDQPYLPLYVKDYLTDEKLSLCSWSTQGIYIKILCILHKSDTYGAFELKAKYKQNKSKIDNFADMIIKYIPCEREIMIGAISELIDEGVMFFDGDKMCQKRMLKDGSLSEKRSNSGRSGGKKGRNSGTKRYYNEPGYLYLIYDRNDKEAFKVGISKEPEKRILGIARKTGRNSLQFRRKWYVNDMGQIEQNVLDYFDDIRDGEWIFGEYKIEEIESKIDELLKNKSKIKANSENEYENEYENIIVHEIKKDSTSTTDNETAVKEILSGGVVTQSDLHPQALTDALFDRFKRKYRETNGIEYVSGQWDENALKKIIKKNKIEALEHLMDNYFDLVTEHSIQEFASHLSDNFKKLKPPPSNAELTARNIEAKNRTQRRIKNVTVNEDGNVKSTSEVHASEPWPQTTY